MNRSNEINTKLDNLLYYAKYNPDSMVDIVKLIDESSQNRFTKDYLSHRSGLMLENDGQIEEIYCAVFPSGDVFDYIISNDVVNALLFVKHAMNWEELGKGFIAITNKELELLTSRNISLYSAHAPVDNSKIFAPSLCFTKQLPFPIVDELVYKNRNYGWVVNTIEPTSYDNLHQKLLQITKLSKIQRYHDHSSVEKIAISAGGGDSTKILELAINKGCDTYVTGILHFRGSEYAKKHNTEFVNELKAQGLNGFGVSHYVSEIEGIKSIADFFDDIFSIPVFFIEESKKHQYLVKNWGIEL